MADEDSCVSCPICMERYSDIRYPIVAPNCGHSICIDCGNKRKSNICVSCTVESFRYLEGPNQPWPCNEWNKNFSLLDIIKLNATQKEELNQFKTKYGRFIPDDIDYMECSSCKSMEKRERMKICESCAEEWNKEWKGMKEEEFVHLIICGFCCLKDHSGHVFIDYLPWKLNHLLSSTVTDGQSTVSSMDEICSYESEKGKEQLEKWNEKIRSFGSLHCKTYREGLSIAKTLKLESDLVTRYSEDCLPPLRKYRKVVTDSTSRLELLRKEVEDETVEGSKAAKEIEEIIGSLDKPSEIEIQKADYEKRIRELEDKLKKVKKVKKNTASIRESIRVRRLPTRKGKVWEVGVSCVDRLYFSVSHTMYLCAVDMYGGMEKPKQVSKGIFKIMDDVTSVGTLDFDAGSIETTQKLTFNESIKLFPNKKYMMQLTVDKDTHLHYGTGGVDKMTLPGYEDHFVSFYNHPDTSGRTYDTDINRGQFPGFYFRIGE